MSELNNIALKIISKGKGILAADESNGTMTKRLDAVNVASNPENRLYFRETLFSAESMKDMGKLMGHLKPIFEGKADMSIVSKLVKELLS